MQIVKVDGYSIIVPENVLPVHPLDDFLLNYRCKKYELTSTYTMKGLNFIFTKPSSCLVMSILFCFQGVDDLSAGHHAIVFGHVGNQMNEIFVVFR